MAQIAMIRRELVEEEGWVSAPRFNRMLAVFQILPGPEAHELCVHLGVMRGGRWGGLAAGLGFMLPGLVLMMALSWAYFSLELTGTMLSPVFLGVQAAVLALIVRATHQIGRHVLLDRTLLVLGAGGLAATLAGAPFWAVLPVAAALNGLVGRRLGVVAALTLAGVAGALLLGSPGPAEPGPNLGPTDEAGLGALLLAGLRTGLLTFGGAYAAIPFLRDDAVGRGWLSDGAFLDGLGLAGVLPAPLIIFATFVGYAAGGPLGALAMTVGVFLPAFAFSLLFFERLEALVENVRARAWLDGVAAGVVGLIAATAVQLGAALIERLPALLPGLVIFGAALAILHLWRARASIPAVLLMAGLAGAALFDRSF